MHHYDEAMYIILDTSSMNEISLHKYLIEPPFKVLSLFASSSPLALNDMTWGVEYNLRSYRAPDLCTWLVCSVNSKLIVLRKDIVNGARFHSYQRIITRKYIHKVVDVLNECEAREFFRRFSLASRQLYRSPPTSSSLSSSSSPDDLGWPFSPFRIRRKMLYLFVINPNDDRHTRAHALSLQLWRVCNFIYRNGFRRVSGGGCWNEVKDAP